MTHTYYIAKDGKTYEIHLHDDSWYADFLAADVKCVDTGRAYYCDFSFSVDDEVEEVEQVYQALLAAREWCERHSRRDIDGEYFDEPNGIYWPK